ncbi:hypothetical protein [Dinoroseobacter shibae]|uniref:hypothetical protein n=1 Tax=Dinoroseobacter shibae TaxID=215813 RepID=UPI0012FF02FA|nr:hypothetical protein [Dinoroseobacter shibae]URF46570.1 hypothetical protein M8008_17600 [Dinoroseobacter shibae]URF50876.1 hypothetical protein M8007_17600 [Dinoroseobacter shibae]
MSGSSRIRENIAVAALALVLSQPVTAQERVAATPLGTLERGGFAVLELDQVFPLSRLLVEIDGDEVLEPLSLDREFLIVPIPENLRGTRHELVLFRTVPGTQVEIERWSFQTFAQGQVDFGSTVDLDAGVRRTEDGETDQFATLNGALDFDLGLGAFTGELNFLWDRNAFGDDESELFVDSYFLQFRQQLDFADLFLKVGTHFIENDTLVMDESQRRGVSVTLGDPTETQRARVFALQASSSVDDQNISGLEDPDDLVFGAEAAFFPVPGSIFKLSLAAQEGKALLGPSAFPGEGSAAGVAVSGGIGPSPLTYEILARTSEWTDVFGRITGTSYQAELSYTLLPVDDPRALEVSIRHFRTSADYFSALDPEFIPGLQGNGVTVSWFGPAVQWSLEASRAKTNTDGLRTRERDKITAVSFDAVYDPGVFTGGFLLGTTFGFSAAYSQQERIRSPFSGAAPQDNQQVSLQFNIDQQRARTAWGVAYSYEIYDDETPTDFDEELQRIDAIYAYTPSEEVTAIAAAGYQYIDAFGDISESAELVLSLDYEFVPNQWSVVLEAGLTESDGPIGADGQFGRAEVAYEFAPENEIYLGMLYGAGTTVLPFAENDGWAVVAGIRLEFDLFSRYRDQF